MTITLKAAIAATSILATLLTPAFAAQDSREAATVKARVAEALRRGDYERAAKLLGDPRARAVFQPTPTDVAAPDSSYEELKGCGGYPQETRLACVIEIKKRSGYDGQVGQIGSHERVYFCVNVLPVNWNPWGVKIWMPLGWGTVAMHDEYVPPVPKSGWNQPNPPFHYSVYRDFDPLTGPRTTFGVNGDYSKTATVSDALTYEVKAILDWQSFLGGDPAVDCSNYVPARGDIEIFQVRADPIR